METGQPFQLVTDDRFLMPQSKSSISDGEFTSSHENKPLAVMKHLAVLVPVGIVVPSLVLDLIRGALQCARSFVG